MPGRRFDPLPDFIEPELATLIERAPEGDAWLHEIKLDGYRTLARIERGKVLLFTRHGLDWTARYGPIPATLASQPSNDRRPSVTSGERQAEGGVVRQRMKTQHRSLRRKIDGWPRVALGRGRSIRQLR